MMRRLLVGIFLPSLALAPAVGAEAPDPLATTRPMASVVPGADKWDGHLEDDAPLVEFQAKAEAAGALGFYRDEKTGSLVVVAPAARTASFDLADLGSAPVPVRLEVSNIDPDALQHARDTLTSLPSTQLDAGASIGFYFNARLQKLTVTTSVAEEELHKLVGDESWRLIDYHHGDVVPANRTNDVAPFWGGAALNPPGGFPDWDCTSGFTMKNASGTRGLLTAAHCALAGDVIRTPQGVTVGTAEDANRRCGAAPVGYNADIQLLTGKTYDKSIYIGLGAGNRADVIEAGDPAVGNKYKFSGMASFEQVDQEVVSLNGQWWAAAGWCGTTFWVLNQIVFNRSGVCDVDKGDSGAPFYFTQAGNPVPTVRIRGMVDGKDAFGCYAMKYSKIHSLLGWSIYTG